MAPRYRFDDRLGGRHGSVRHFHDHGEALRFLRAEASDFVSLGYLRVWADRRGFGSRLDRDLFQFAATGLVSGELTVRPVTRVILGGTPGPSPSTRPSEAIPRNEAPARAASVGLRKAPTKPPPKPANTLDVDQQVAALMAAAKSGTPFCEQCARAAKEQVK